MKLTNPWVGYLSRSYKDIKTSLLNRLGKVAPEMTDHSESNIMIIVLDAIAGVAESLNYYIDNVARESFISTARRYSSAVKLSRLLDYRIKAKLAASVDLTITFFDVNGDPVNNNTQFTIPAGSRFYDDSGIDFVNPSNVIVTSGTSSVIVPVVQRTFVNDDNLGTLSGVEDETLLLPEDYLHNSISLVINGEDWIRKDTLAFSASDDNHFIVEVSTEKRAYIRFGDGINGRLAPGTFDVIADYYTTLGSGGNIQAGIIKNTDFDFQVNNINSVNITNILATSGGADVESLSNLKKALPLSIRTLNKAVTKQDFTDIGNLAPGVLLADASFVCGDPYITLNIYPQGGGIASSVLLSSTEDYFDDKIAYPLILKAIPMGESYLSMYVDVVGKPRKKYSTIISEIQEALEAKYGIDDPDKILRQIRLSDIVAAIDNLPSVDYLVMNDFYVTPFIKPFYHSTPLGETSFELDEFPEVDTKFTITYTNSDDTYRLLKNGVYQNVLNKGNITVQQDNYFSIGIPNTSHGTDLEWTFVIYKRGDVVLNDLSIPIYDHQNSTFNITETN